MILADNRRLGAALVGAALVLATSAPASADPCTRVRVATQREGTSASWRSAIASLRTEIARLSDTECTTLDLAVTTTPAGARVMAIAPDGRRAERDVASPSELTAIGMGLIASIPPEDPPVPPPPAETPASARTAALELPPPDVAQTAPRPIESPPPCTVSATLGTRLGMPTGVIAPELELRGDVRIDGWIASLSGRAAVAGGRPGATFIAGYDYQQFSFGASTGRRLVLGRAGLLDITAGPRVGVITEEGDVPIDGAGGSKTDVWIEGAVRWIAATGGRWRPTALVQIEGSPARFVHAARVDAGLPALPSWSFGLHVGVAGDVP